MPDRRSRIANAVFMQHIAGWTLDLIVLLSETVSVPKSTKVDIM